MIGSNSEIRNAPTLIKGTFPKKQNKIPINLPVLSYNTDNTAMFYS